MFLQFDKETFAASLQIPGNDWLRATGYHESVAGMLDVTTLDRIVPTRRCFFQEVAGHEGVIGRGHFRQTRYASAREHGANLRERRRLAAQRAL